MLSQGRSAILWKLGLASLLVGVACAQTVPDGQNGGGSGGSSGQGAPGGSPSEPSGGASTSTQGGAPNATQGGAAAQAGAPPGPGRTVQGVGWWMERVTWNQYQ